MSGLSPPSNIAAVSPLFINLPSNANSSAFRSQSPNDIDEMAAVSSLATEDAHMRQRDEESDKEKRRQAKVAARELRLRKQQKWQRLEDEVSALRLKVAELRTVRADFGLPPVDVKTKPQHPRTANDEEEMELYLGPKPVLPSGGATRRYQSTLAAREFRWRKIQRRRMLEDEVVALRAEVFEFHVQMRRVGARL